MQRSEYRQGARVRYERRTATLKDLDSLRGIATISFVVDDTELLVPLEELELLDDVSHGRR
jgi:hypothetical protein